MTVIHLEPVTCPQCNCNLRGMDTRHENYCTWLWDEIRGHQKPLWDRLSIPSLKDRCPRASCHLKMSVRTAEHMTVWSCPEGHYEARETEGGLRR